MTLRSQPIVPGADDDLDLLCLCQLAADAVFPSVGLARTSTGVAIVSDPAPVT